PASRMPTCSCGCACSSTTAPGSISTTDSIIFSAAQVRMWTPGKIVCRLISSGVGKNSLITGLAAEMESAGECVRRRGRCSRSAAVLQAGQERDQVDELLLSEALLQALRHRAERRRPLLVDLALRHHVLLPLAVGQRERLLGLRDL